MSHTYPVNITCISWLFLWCAVLLPLKLLTWLPIIGFKATALQTFVPLIYYHWEPNHNGKCNQCGYLAETGVLSRERGGHLASDSSRRLNRSQPFRNSRLTQQAIHLNAEDVLKEPRWLVYARMTTWLLYFCHQSKRRLLSAFKIPLKGFVPQGKPMANTEHTGT